MKSFKSAKSFFIATHIIGSFSEKPLKYVLLGSAKSGGDMSGELSSDFVKYLIMHDDGWFENICSSDKKEEMACAEVRKKWPVAYRNLNVSANRAAYFLLADASMTKTSLGPVYDRYKHIYGKSPASGSLDLSRVDPTSETIKIRIKQLAKFKADLDQNPGFREIFQKDFCRIKATSDLLSSAKDRRFEEEN